MGESGGMRGRVGGLWAAWGLPWSYLNSCMVSKIKLPQRLAVHLFRNFASHGRVRGMTKLGYRLYDPYQRGDDYLDGVLQCNGNLIQIDTRSFVEWWIYMFGAFEGAATDLLKRFVHSKSIIIDVGANIGAFTLPLAQAGGTVFVRTAPLTTPSFVNESCTQRA